MCETSARLALLLRGRFLVVDMSVGDEGGRAWVLDEEVEGISMPALEGGRLGDKEIDQAKGRSHCILPFALAALQRDGDGMELTHGGGGGKQDCSDRNWASPPTKPAGCPPPPSRRKARNSPAGPGGTGGIAPGAVGTSHLKPQQELLARKSGLTPRRTRVSSVGIGMIEPSRTT